MDIEQGLAINLPKEHRDGHVPSYSASAGRGHKQPGQHNNCPRMADLHTHIFNHLLNLLV